MIPSVLITTVMYIRSTRILEEKKGDSIVNGLEQTSRVMDTILTDAEYQLIFLTINPENLSKLARITRRAHYSDDPLIGEIWTRIHDYCLSNRNILAMYIYLYKPQVILTSFENRKVIEVNNPGHYFWLNIPINPNTNSSGWWFHYAMPESITESGLGAFFLKKKIQSVFTERPVGEACIAVEEYYIRYKLLDSIREGKKGSVLLLDAKGRVLSAASDQRIVNQNMASLPYIRFILNKQKGSFISRVNGIKMLIGFTTSVYTGWKYVSMMPIREVTLNTVEIRNLALWVNLLAVSLAIILAWGFSQSIYRPIRVLKDSMKSAESGDFNVQISGNRKDEFGMLNRGFNRMIKQIQRLIIELYHEKLLKKEAELKNLQAQMNPHFLYNTLDSIHWLARLNKLEEVSQLTFALSNFYKLSLGGGRETITVQETLTLIEEYLKIQKVRYGDKILIQEKVDETLLQYQVLPLIIQPLVENAIGHGIEEKKGPGEIKVKVSPWNQGMVFIIADNGRGIEPPKMQQIRDSLAAGTIENGDNFALVNIHQRIQLYYGKQYGLEIQSEVDQGTTVTVYLPCWIKSKREEAKVDVQIIDS